MKKILRIIRNNFRVYINPLNIWQNLIKAIPQQILSGPFEGMEYTNISYGSCYYPKIFGTYEKEISHIFSSGNIHKFNSFIDIGCAEGYYLCGVSYLKSKESSPSFSRLLGYDIDKDALKEAKKLLELNQIKNYELKTSGYENDLVNIVTPALLICDVEGAEEDILDPDRIKVLLDFHILVEIHDEPGTSVNLNLISSRFTGSHRISRYSHKERQLADFPKLKRLRINKDFRIKLMEEGRMYGKNWLYMEPKNRIE